MIALEQSVNHLGELRRLWQQQPVIDLAEVVVDVPRHEAKDVGGDVAGLQDVLKPVQDEM